MQKSVAFSLLETKAIDDEKRIIKGIASTPTPDRVNDVVNPMGAIFKTPFPLLYMHNHDQPVGWVKFAKPTKNGIPYEAQIDTPEEDDPQPLKDRLNIAWKEVKRRLVAGVSIGFKGIEWSYIDGGGIHFDKWEWLELSLVTIPANSEATISSVKSLWLPDHVAKSQDCVKLIHSENKGAVKLCRAKDHVRLN